MTGNIDNDQDAPTAWKFVVHDEKMPFFEAEHHCAMDGGHLASIHSAEENEEVFSLVTTDAAHWYWIGFTMFDRDIWGWTDSSPVNFGTWHSDQPHGGND